VFVSAEDNSVQRFDLAAGTKVSFVAHESWVNALAYSPDGQLLYTGGCDGRMIVWPATADAPQPLKVIEAHPGLSPWVRTISVSPDGAMIATGGNDGLVRLWKAADGTALGTLAGHQKNVYSTLFHPDGKLLISGDLAGVIQVWDLAAAKSVGTFDAKDLWSYNEGQGVDYGGVRGLALSPDGKFLAAGGLYKASNPLGAVNEPLALLFDWETRQKKQSHVVAGVNGIIWRLCFHPEGFLIGGSGGSGGGHIAFWKPEGDKEQHKFTMPTMIRDLDLHPDGLQIATAHYDRLVRISSMTPAPKT
jgi:WD40 repeat protein